VLFYWFGWEAHAEVSHSLAVIVLLLALWLAALSYVERPSMSRALILGVVVGVGFLAKWSFFFVVLGLCTAFAMEKKSRWVFTDKRSLIIPIVAGLVILPSLLWVANLDPQILASNVNVPKPDSPFGRTLRILGQFAVILCVVFLPWALVLVALYFRGRREFARNASTDAPIRVALIAAGVSGGSLVAILLATALGDLNLFGISDFAPHYLQPSCILAAIGIAGFISARVDSSAFAQRLGLISLLTALIIFIVKLASFYIVPSGVAMAHLLPYKGLAKELDARGFAQAQFVALSAKDAGNLIMYLPQARALSPSRRKEPPPPDPMSGRPCVLLWGGEYSVPPNPPKSTRPERLLLRLGLDPGNHVAQDIQVEWQQPLIGETRRSVWHLVWDPIAQERCRSYVASGGIKWPFREITSAPRRR
jgi:4-amino-4-deoxy-L-arabinose transferase-like glycosyltransferase